MVSEVPVEAVKALELLIITSVVVVILIIGWLNKIAFRTMYKLRLEELKSRWFAFVANPKTEKEVTAETFDFVIDILDHNIKWADLLTASFVFSLAWEGRRQKQRGVDMSRTLFSDDSVVVQEEVRYIQNQMTWALHRFLASQSVVYTLYAWGHWIARKLKHSSDGKYPRKIDEVRRRNLQDGGSVGMAASH